MTDTLTDNERAELEQLRAEKNAPAESPKAEEAPLPDTHWLHLGDGTVIRSKGVATHVGDIPVLHAVEIPPTEEIAPAHRF